MPQRPLFTLDPRLKLCADMVRPGTTLADVGTDHAYLPVWLVRRGIIPSAIAADINPKPLKRAKEHIERYHVEDRVQIRLSDGLASIKPWEADDIVIAGMGGELIIQIIKAAPWLCTEQKQLILQPMTSVPELRRSLYQNSFSVLEEQAVESAGHVYTVMCASFRREKENLPEWYEYVGKLSGKDAASSAYLCRTRQSLQKKVEGLKKAGTDDQPSLERAIAYIDRILQRGNF